MTFEDMLARVLELLQREGRVTYRALKRRFELDDEYLADLCGELIDAKRVARDEDGKVLVWRGAAPVPGAPFPVASPEASPAPRAMSRLGLRTQDSALST